MLKEIIQAVKKGDCSLVKSLLDNGADPNDADFDGITALMYAAENGSIDVVKLLLDNGADSDINGKDFNLMEHWGWGFTALMEAAYRGHVDVV